VYKRAAECKGWEVILVVDIVIYNTIFSLDVLYKGKSLANALWILALGPLVVISTCETGAEL
jgi:hypothetical protein